MSGNVCSVDDAAEALVAELPNPPRSQQPGRRSWQLTVAPNGPAQDADIFLMGSNPTNPATFVQSRTSAVASSARGGPGVSETLTYTPPVSGWFGVVVNVRSAIGDVTLTRS